MFLQILDAHKMMHLVLSAKTFGKFFQQDGRIASRSTRGAVEDGDSLRWRDPRAADRTQGLSEQMRRFLPFQYPPGNFLYRSICCFEEFQPRLEVERRAGEDVRQDVQIRFICIRFLFDQHPYPWVVLVSFLVMRLVVNHFHVRVDQR